MHWLYASWISGVPGTAVPTANAYKTTGNRFVFHISFQSIGTGALWLTKISLSPQGPSSLRWSGQRVFGKSVTLLWTGDIHRRLSVRGMALSSIAINDAQ